MFKYVFSAMRVSKESIKQIFNRKSDPISIRTEDE